MGCRQLASCIGISLQLIAFTCQPASALEWALEAPLPEASKSLQWEEDASDSLTEINNSTLSWQLIEEGDEDVATNNQENSTQSETDLIFNRSHGPARSLGWGLRWGSEIYPGFGTMAFRRAEGQLANLTLSGTPRPPHFAPEQCNTYEKITKSCGDGLMHDSFTIWNGAGFSFDISWTLHSLSGGTVSIAGRTQGTTFGQGQSLGFRWATNLSPTTGLEFGGDQLVHLDDTTDLGRSLYLNISQLVPLGSHKGAPLLNFTVGLGSDALAFNPNMAIGTMRMPVVGPEPYLPSGLNGIFPYPKYKWAGISSPLVCLQKSYSTPSAEQLRSSGCNRDVLIGPLFGIGFAPAHWIGFSFSYRNVFNVTMSLKPWKNIPFFLNVEVTDLFLEVNPLMQGFYKYSVCTGGNEGRCAPRLGLGISFAF